MSKLKYKLNRKANFLIENVKIDFTKSYGDSSSWPWPWLRRALFPSTLSQIIVEIIFYWLQIFYIIFGISVNILVLSRNGHFKFKANLWKSNPNVSNHFPGFGSIRLQINPTVFHSDRRLQISNWHFSNKLKNSWQRSCQIVAWHQNNCLFKNLITIHLKDKIIALFESQIINWRRNQIIRFWSCVR